MLALSPQYLVAHFFGVVVFTVFCFNRPTEGLECIQCSNQHWDNTREKCLDGTLPPTSCPKPSHTHCLTNFFKVGGKRTVNYRGCGTSRNVSCALHGIPPAEPRDPKDRKGREAWEEKSEEEVVVCIQGCTYNGCNSATSAVGTPLLLHPAIHTLTAILSSVFWNSVYS